MIATKISNFIGKTPLLEIKVGKKNWRLLLKLEKFNPGQSMKDRMALNMIDHAEATTMLRKGGCIIESTSGNTGIGVAIIAAERGYRFIAVVDNHAAKDKLALMEAYGTELVFVKSDLSDSGLAVSEREELAEQLSKEIPNSYFLRQADNPANSEAYFKTLGPEIWEDTSGNVDYYLAAIGTGGSLCGTARYLKLKKPSIKVIGIEPFGSVIFGGVGGPYYQSGSGNPGNVSIAENIDYSLIDLGCKVTDAEAFCTSRHFAKHKGIFLGGTSGGVLYKALEYIQTNESGGTIVALMADGGEKYLGTIFNDRWMKEHSLLDEHIKDQLDQWLV